MNRSILTRAGLFVGSAALSFSLVAERAAAAVSVVYTVSARGCASGSAGYMCTLPGGSQLASLGGLAGAYFDYRTTGASTLVSSALYKQTYTGTVYTDYLTQYVSSGWHDDYITASQVNVNFSLWDYLFAETLSAAEGAGVIVLSKN
jgi:hypothetical protein